MALTKQEKKEVFKKVNDALEASSSMVFVNYNGLTVAEAIGLRRGLKAEGVSYAVVKKSIAKKALAEKKISGEQPPLEGQMAIAYSSDLIAPSRGIFQLGKKLDNKIKILGGIFEGKYMSQSEMLEIALIPPLQVLRGQFVNLINSPIQGLVIALDAIAKTKTS